MLCAMRRDNRGRGENTRAVHLPPDAFAQGIASLEGFRLSEPAEGEAFASGMAAVTAVLLAFTGAGAHVVAPAGVSAGTRGLLAGPLARFGVETTFADMADPAAVRAAIRPRTRLVWAETLGGPGLAVADLPLLAGIAREAGALLAVDSTRATPVVCRPLEHGADLVVHADASSIGGYGEAAGGAVVGAAHLVAEVRLAGAATGSALAPGEASALRRGLETLPLRVRRQCDTASMFAASLARHPAVRVVHYPGLPGHPGHALARELFDAGPEGTRFGASVTVVPHGGRAAGLALAEALRLAAAVTGPGGPAPGGMRTRAEHVASAAVRFSIGLEDADDLVRDVTEALGAEGGGVPAPAPPAGADPLVADTG